ncbi:MAG TPA: hypothetical protein VH593_15370 [Ktedonobacteraceae bacterium]
MPALAGWLTGEQVSPDIIEQTLSAMGTVLGQHGGESTQSILPGAGFISFADAAYAMQQSDEPPVLDWVPDRRTLVYRRPLSGQHPLYFIENWPAQGNVIFASEIKALFAVGAPRRIHLGALSALWRYGFIPAPWTIFRDIQVVPAGSILRWQRAHTVVNQATDYQLEQVHSESDAHEQLQTLLDEVSAAYLPQHEQLIAFTNGAASSATAICMAAQHTNAPFPIATLSNKKSLSAKIWQAAEQVATTCQRPFFAITGVDQPEFWLTTLTAIEAPSLDTRPYALHQLFHTTTAETEARVAITGLGAKVLMADTRENETPASPDTLARYREMLMQSPCQAGDPPWSAETREALSQQEHWEDTLHARKLARKAEQLAEHQQGLYYLDLHMRLPDYIVGPAQQLALQERLSLRSPYLSMRSIDNIIHMPHRQHFKADVLNRLATHYLGDLTSQTPALALPCASFFGDSEIVQQVLAPESIRATGIFDTNAVQQLLAQKKGGEQALLYVFTTQMLCQLFQAEV